MVTGVLLPRPVNPLGLMRVYQCQRGANNVLGVVKISQNSGEGWNFRALAPSADGDTLRKHEKGCLKFRLLSKICG
jgi:hypothetical protein